MGWVRRLPDVGWPEAWAAELMAQTVAPRAPTMLTVVRKAPPTAQAPRETAGEQKEVWEAY
jgi:hypothetical protein